MVLLLIRGDDSVLHSLLENVFVVLAGLLEHAMLPAEFSRSGLKTLLLYGSCQVAFTDDGLNIIFAGCARSFRTEHLKDLAELLTARVISFAGSIRSKFRKSGGMMAIQGSRGIIAAVQRGF